ncbi:hypothetical protein CVD25_22410 [Bacillus canaveralius]|uniref:Uncharacterized protein n=1 Tax=Bacillus canaveralius TaxID=1403243 RepID=A0A2N5GIU5_9BACI|nr:hypothetical protein [Bacillus canaveralius]PLR80949.1 hypothetical protein CU635_16420 [Bacillus canaveralius]PLR88591.1 hypothetical protein CVD25_22410 [Bacillus canaveralius]
MLDSNYTTKDGEIVTKKDYYNKQGEVIKSETEKAITPTASGDSITTLAAPHWVANTIVGKEWQFGWPQLRVYGTGSSKSYTSSSKTTYRAIDRIGVNTTLYYNNAVEDTATQTKSNAAVASATAWQQSTNCCWQYKGQTTHTFQEAGYQSWYPVTTDYSS